ncbi:MAG: heparan N-sulfatase, partial [Verrucomicrobia bacterium]
MGRLFLNTAVAGLLAMLVIGWPLCSNAQERPNVILIIGDDISWNDFGCYGNSGIRTPNIDRLAASGMRFDNAFL